MRQRRRAMQRTRAPLRKRKSVCRTLPSRNIIDRDDCPRQSRGDQLCDLMSSPGQARGRSLRVAASLLCFAGLVTFAERSDPIPSRTRPSNAQAPMVLCLKTWESRSLPGLPNTATLITRTPTIRLRQAGRSKPCPQSKATWRGVEQPGSSSGS